MPVCIGCIDDHAPVEIGRAIVPPHRPALAQGDLGRIDGRARSSQARGVVCGLGLFHLASGGHQLVDQSLAHILGQ
jgi:hypothetical protein